MRLHIAARSKTSCSPGEGIRPTIFLRESTCVVGPVPSPGGFFNGLLADFHLHRALFRDKEELKRARALIEQCGYWRRKQELEDAEVTAKA